MSSLSTKKKKTYKDFSSAENQWNDVEGEYKKLLVTCMQERDEIDILDEIYTIISNYGFNQLGEVDYYGHEYEKYEANINQIENYIKKLTEFEKDFLTYLNKECCVDKLKKLMPYKKINKILHSATDIVNFNYTMTIEEIYKVERINHIHGCIKDSIAIGTGSLEEIKNTMIYDTYATLDMFEPTKYGLIDKMMYFEYDMEDNLVEKESVKRFFDEVKHRVKEQEKQLFNLLDAKNKDRLMLRVKTIEHLSKIYYDKVYIIGHSLNMADAQVLKAIQTKEIICYYYENSERNEHQIMKDRIEQLQLNNYQLVSDKEIFV